MRYLVPPTLRLAAAHLVPARLCRPALELLKYVTAFSAEKLGFSNYSDSAVRGGVEQRFELERRGFVASLFHRWARTTSFQQPDRLLSKVRLLGRYVHEDLQQNYLQVVWAF